MTMPAAPVPPIGVAGRPGMPGGAARMSCNYYDAGKLKRSRRPVPVNEFGEITAVEYVCRRHGSPLSKWVPLTVRKIPVCDVCSRVMVVERVTAPPLLPWRELWTAIDRPLRPVWALVAAGGTAFVVDAAEIPAWPVVGVAPLAGWAAATTARKVLVARQVKKGRLELEDLDGDKRLRAAIARSARWVGYTTAGGLAALAVVAGLGVDLSTWAGRAAAAAVVAAWLLPAASWWRAHRNERNRPAPAIVEAEDVPFDGPSDDPDEVEVRRVWATVLARPAQIGPDGQSKVRAGRLVGTWLEDWHRVDGGWAATVCSQPGDYVGESFMTARGAVASAFRMKATMITVIPDGDDETRALILAQRTSPIGDVVRWSGPDTVNAETGVAEMARYVDGTPTLYELYRPGWGSPHDFLCGTTGAGKSEALSMLLLLDRWAHRTDPDGTKHGIVADLLIDPQQGQSYEPFMDDLAAPVATSLDEAFLLVEAFKAEMLRRNAYLSKKGWKDPRTGVVHRPEWTDKRGRKRFGRKWWNPLVDGPILALNIDEAHEYLANREFAHLVTAGARMYRKCGMRIRVATHTPLLTDLGGSMALRDMLTGGFVWVGRTANSLSGPTAFNGRLPVDPRTIEAVPGTAFILTGPAPKAMKARTMWEPDFYDWVRDDNDTPIGYPAALPDETRFAFGPAFAKWVASRDAGDDSWQPSTPAPEARPPAGGKAVDAVFAVLAAASAPMDMDEIDAALTGAGTRFATRTVREALRDLRERGRVFSSKGRHEVTPQACDADAVREEQRSLFDAESEE